MANIKKRYRPVYKILNRNLKRRDGLDDLCMDRRIILKCKLKQLGSGGDSICLVKTSDQLAGLKMVTKICFLAVYARIFLKTKGFWDVMLCRWTISFRRFERSVVMSCSGSDSASTVDEC